MLEDYMERGAENATNNNNYYELNTNAEIEIYYLHNEDGEDVIPF
jgi:hypothetical protein